MTHLPAPIISYADSKQLQGEAKPAPPNTGGSTEHGIRSSPPMSFVKKHVLQIVNNFLKIQRRMRFAGGSRGISGSLVFTLLLGERIAQSAFHPIIWQSVALSEHEAISEHWIWKLRSPTTELNTQLTADKQFVTTPYYPRYLIV